MDTFFYHVAVASLNQIPLDWKHNQNNIISAIQAARAQHIRLLCLPELCISGYGCEDAFLLPETANMAWQALQNIVPHTQNITVCLGLPLWYQQSLLNTVCLVSHQRILGFVAKKHLPNDGVHYEPRWFKPWPNQQIGEFKRFKKRYSLGDLIFEQRINSYTRIKIGFEICEEAWVKQRTGYDLAKQDVDIILNPSASHFSFFKHQKRQDLVKRGSKIFNCHYLYSNLLGNEAGRIIYDGDCMIASHGKIMAQSTRFSFKDYTITDCNIEIKKNKIKNKNRPKNVIYFTSKINDTNIVKSTKQKTWDNKKNIKQEEFTRAVCLGLFDYLRKSHAQGFVVSLSGGADSSAICCLIVLMIHQGIKELGQEKFLDQIKNKELLETKNNINIPYIIKTLLTCVYQRTKQNSKTTEQAAETLAHAIFANYLCVDIDSLVLQYTKLAEQCLNKTLTWQEHGISLQNIQARTRSPLVWFIANIKKSILISTSNRSEAAVGYATMDGDTSGGISPLSGIDKHYLRQWLQWLEKDGPYGLFNIPSLSLVNKQAPTAELKPLKEKQTDEQDLMPYEILNDIEQLLIVKKTPVDKILKTLRKKYQQTNPKELTNYIKKFLTLFTEQQWKRERYAPSFHLDNESLDPKGFFRFPILSGGFKEELKKLKN